MGFLNNLRKSMAKGLPEGWLELTSLKDLEEAVELSNKRIVLFFKHSVRCGISSSVKEDFIKSWDVPTEKVQVFYLDLIKNRDVSDAIAERFDVVHQSPQVIGINHGEVIYSNSHHAINAPRLMQLIDKV